MVTHSLPVLRQSEEKPWLAFLLERQLISEGEHHQLSWMLNSTHGGAWRKESRELAYNALLRFAMLHPEQFTAFRTMRRLTQ